MVNEFTVNLIYQITLEVKGYVKAYTDGELLVTKIIATNGNTWCYFEDNISLKLSQGLSSTDLAQRIVKTYRNYVLQYYFKQKEKPYGTFKNN